MVCPWNLRRFGRLVDEVNNDPVYTEVMEVRGEPHWWGGAVDFGNFFNRTWAAPRPRLPALFRVHSVHSWTADTSRGGLRVLQSVTSARLARLLGNRHSTVPTTWAISTSNVRRFGLVLSPEEPSTLLPAGDPVPTHLSIDGMVLLVVQTLHPVTRTGQCTTVA